MSDKKDEIIIIDQNERGEQVTTSSDERLLAMLIYVTSFFTTIIGPLIIWLVKREESAFIHYHGKEYLNFIIFYFVYGIIAALSMIILIGFILAPIVVVAAFVLTIIASINAFNGNMYHIPFIF